MPEMESQKHPEQTFTLPAAPLSLQLPSPPLSCPDELPVVAYIPPTSKIHGGREHCHFGSLLDPTIARMLLGSQGHKRLSYLFKREVEAQ